MNARDPLLINAFWSLWREYTHTQKTSWKDRHYFKGLFYLGGIGLLPNGFVLAFAFRGSGCLFGCWLRYGFIRLWYQIVIYIVDRERERERANVNILISIKLDREIKFGSVAEILIEQFIVDNKFFGSVEMNVYCKSRLLVQESIYLNNFRPLFNHKQIQYKHSRKRLSIKIFTSNWKRIPKHLFQLTFFGDSHLNLHALKLTKTNSTNAKTSTTNI